MILYILKNAHSSLEWYAERLPESQNAVNWTVWREPWNRFVSGIWTDVVGKQQLDKPHTKNHTVDELITKIKDENWMRQQMEGDGHESLFYNAGHMMSQWNYLTKECHRRKLKDGYVRIQLMLGENVCSFPTRGCKNGHNIWPTRAGHNCGRVCYLGFQEVY